MVDLKYFDPDPLMCAILVAGLCVIVPEIEAVHYGLNKLLGGLAALLTDGLWKIQSAP